MTDSLRRQRTIASPAGVAGFGYWSGRDVQVQLRPAAADTGIVFVRRDLNPAPRIAAGVRNRIEMPRRTSLGAEGGRVEMVEHLMAALAGLQIDNCEIWIDGAELPGCDGSASAFVEALQQAGIRPQDALRPRLAIQRRVRVGTARSWVEAQPEAGPGLTLTCFLDYGTSGPIGRQVLQLAITPESFCRELATARTFILQEEAVWMRQQGLGSRVTSRDLLVFDAQGPIDNPLRFPDECVRHKLLDLVGDLALSGCDLAGHVVAYCGGHRLNAELVGALLASQADTSAYRKTA